MKFKSKNQRGTEFIWDAEANRVVAESEDGIFDTEDSKLIERFKREGYEETDGVKEPVVDPLAKDKKVVPKPKGKK